MRIRTSSIVAALLSLFVFLSVGSAVAESLTFDEIVDIEEGKRILLTHTFTEPFNPPLIRQFSALPLVLGSERYISSDVPAIQALPARFVVILLGAALALCVFIVVREVAGSASALLALFLMILEPTVLAHSHYITMDVGVTFFFFLSYIAFLKAIDRPTLLRLFVFSLLLGLAFASKITSIAFFAATVAVFLFQRRVGLQRLSKKFMLVIFCLVITSVTIWATYFFTTDVIIRERADQKRVSYQIIEFSKKHNLPFVESLVEFGRTQKVPLGTYIAAIKNTIIRGKQGGEVFFMGKFYSASKWYFFPITILYKTPLPLLIFFTLGCVYLIRTKANLIAFSTPIIGVLLVLSISSLSPQVRYALPLYPFIIMIASQSLRLFQNRFLRFVFILLCLWYAYAAGSSYPHFISYANELIGFKGKRHEVFIDSNLDWGQSLPDVAAYVPRVGRSNVSFSYFGRDDGDAYGLPSDFLYGSHTINEICAFHRLRKPVGEGKPIRLISATNWYSCGYYLDPQYAKEHISAIVGGSVLVFD